MTVVLPITAECPKCGHLVDDASDVEGTDDRPTPGDVAICIACAEPGFYVLSEDELSLKLRAATEDEKVSLSGDTRYTNARRIILMTNGIWFDL